MTTSLLADAFAHHTWATLRLLDACLALPPEQLGTTVPGTYGSILDTMRHLVGSDAAYLSVLSDGLFAPVDEDGMDLAGLRATMERDAAGWAELLAGEIDPDRVLIRHLDDGAESHATAGIRLAQVIHHGTDHRSQVCTALTALGIEPPEIDVWDYARSQGGLLVVPPAG